MSQSFRHPEILSIARRDGKVTVEGLAEHFGVTLQTIRRDLSDLADSGRLERVHGGAIVATGTMNIGYEDRRQLHRTEKQAIAAACVQRIPNGTSLFLNIGTTTEAVAEALLAHKDLLVVTNNVNVATILSRHPSCEVVVTGGTLRRTDGGLVGPLASETIRQFKVDLAVIGCSALDNDGDMLDFDIQEVGVSRTILGQARGVYLVADGSKFGRKAPVRVGSLEEVDACFTDRPLSAALSQKCRTWSTEIVLC